MKNKFLRNTKNIISLLAVCVIFIVYIWQTFNTHKYNKKDKVIAWDVISYYEYLPATFIEKDYTLSFVDTDWESSHYWYVQTPEGKRVIKTSMGMSMMYAPFFFTAHFFAPVFGFAQNGFTNPYALALLLGSIFYVIVGCFFLRRVLLDYFSDTVVAIVLIIICLTTNLFWYATLEGPMSHAYSFSLFSIFLYLTDKWHRQQKIRQAIFLGLIFGLISLVRPTNGLIALLFILYNVVDFKAFKRNVSLFLKKYHHILLIAFFAFLVWVPQFLYWKAITGKFLYFSYGSDERFFFADPKILDVLFSFRKGLFIYAPVIIFAFIGIIFMFKQQTKKYFWGVILFLSLNIYIVSCWWCWWYGGGLGMRALIETYAILAIPLGEFLTWVLKKSAKKRAILLTLVTVFALRSAFFNVQYRFGIVHWDSMTRKAYFYSFWKVHGSAELYELLEAPDYEKAKQGIR